MRASASARIISALVVPVEQSFAMTALRRLSSVAPAAGVMPTRRSHSARPQVAVGTKNWSATFSVASQYSMATSVMLSDTPTV